MRCTVEREAGQIQRGGSWSYHFGRIEGVGVRRATPAPGVSSLRDALRDRLNWSERLGFPLIIGAIARSFLA
ncbi:hypothetical protein [Tolypothrix sp. NIES-4075]|uniref:hypothetical protein n=1 Tax=Tolypothrix sp. NIES-4075 TaxID=2005459 RepID=UPI00117F13CF|nr:hypothetical protein [Tolypothrix sp. NIES-4075]